MTARVALAWICLAGCYTNAPANRDVSAAWRGRTRGELEHRWGGPSRVEPGSDPTVLVWTHHRLHVELPSAAASVTARPVATRTIVTGPGGELAVATRGTAYEVRAELRPGAVWNTTTEAAAVVDPAGVITRVEGAALRWGPPNDVNLHWGTIFGAHVGLGRLDAARSPLPSGGAYLGGMLGPTLGLVGALALAAGSSSTGSAIGLSGGIGLQWWPVNRLWLRAGPAMLLSFAPGFADPGLHPGVAAGASLAFVKLGVLALDLRLDLAAGSTTSFGTVGVGVNVN